MLSVPVLKTMPIAMLLTKRKNLRLEIKEAQAALVQVERELLRRQPKSIYVSMGDDSYQFELETSNGRRRVRPKGCQEGEEMCLESGQLSAWFARIGVTHVVSKFGETSTSPECIKDGKYTVTSYLKWWKQLGDGEDD